MKKALIIVSIFIFLLFSCAPVQPEKKLRTAKGNVNYGGSLRVNQNHPLISLYPHLITDHVSAHIGSHLYENLVKFDSKDLSILPSIATNWEMDATGTIYTFTLKKGVFFHDNVCFPDGKGRELKASDVKYTFELLCTPGPFNQTFGSTLKGRLKGADEYYESSSDEAVKNLSGIKILDDYTIQLILEKPNFSFLYILASPPMGIVAKEAVGKYGNMLKVGTGPFVYTENKLSDDVILVRNENYHGTDSLGNQLPYLDTLKFSFIDSKTEELKAFQERKIDLIIGLPSESVKEVVESHINAFQKEPPVFILDRSPELTTHFYEFNTSNSVFKDKKLRQAFSYAIDRNRILNEVLKGEAFGPGIYGISPPSFEAYDITQIKGYSYDPDKAKKLLAEAGYPGGKDFPAIKLVVSAEASRNMAVALDVSKQIKKVLNIDINLDIVPYAVNLEDSRFSRGDIIRSAWIADYPSPESFLSLLYGKPVPKTMDLPSFPNTTRYINPQFDSLFESGISAADKKAANTYFLQAEQMMMEDAPLLVLWYDEKYRLYQSNVRNFYPNPINYWDFSQVYLNKK